MAAERVYLPPGWPAAVHPPGTPDFEQTATNWLLDQCPPELRHHAVLRRHPVVLCRFAWHHTVASTNALQHALATARADLTAELPPGVIEDVVSAYEIEMARVAKVCRAVGLLGQALRGQEFTARL